MKCSNLQKTSDDTIDSRVNIENHDDAQDWRLACISMLE